MTYRRTSFENLRILIYEFVNNLCQLIFKIYLKSLVLVSQYGQETRLLIPGCLKSACQTESRFVIFLYIVNRNLKKG